MDLMGHLGRSCLQCSGSCSLLGTCGRRRAHRHLSIGERTVICSLSGYIVPCLPFCQHKGLGPEPFPGSFLCCCHAQDKPVCVMEGKCPFLKTNRFLRFTFPLFRFAFPINLDMQRAKSIYYDLCCCLDFSWLYLSGPSGYVSIYEWGCGIKI